MNYEEIIKQISLIESFLSSHQHDGVSSSKIKKLEDLIRTGGSDFQNPDIWSVDNTLPVLFYSDDIEETDSTARNDYVKKEALYSDVPGTITISVDAVSNVSGGLILKIIKNSTTLSTTTIGTAPATTVTVNTTITTGDAIKISITQGAGKECAISNFRLYGAKVCKPTLVSLVS